MSLALLALRSAASASKADVPLDLCPRGAKQVRPSALCLFPKGNKHKAEALGQQGISSSLSPKVRTQSISLNRSLPEALRRLWRSPKMNRGLPLAPLQG